jgi:hypothetical protein|tara:strand:- start:263 stop:547 length:285 start_codon:yes stop_codon:yes gene_type:complete
MDETHEFLMKVKDHFAEIAQLIKDYEMEDRILAASMIGVLDPLDEDNSDLTAIYAMNIDSREELDVVTDFLVDAYEENNPDLSDLLGGLGISLN